MSYSRVSFQSVIDLVAALAGENPEALNDVDKALLRRLIADKLEKWAWPAWQWPETTLVEVRRYRNTYSSATTYAAPSATSASEVFFPATRQYYQALRSTLNNAPATVSGSTWVTNDAYWAVCGGPYSGEDWAESTDYIAADIVRNTDDGRFYQCHTAHTSSTSFDATKFGILTEFDPYIARAQSWETNEIGDFLGTYLDNPNLVRNPRRVANRVDVLGAHVMGTSGWPFEAGMGSALVPHEVWVKFRLPCPDMHGGDFSASATYAAGVIKWYSSSTAGYEGDFWECQDTTSAGEDPEDTPAKWTRLEFPAWLRSCVARRALADWLRADGANEKARLEDAGADDALYQAQLLAGQQQGQVMRWRMSA